MNRTSRALALRELVDAYASAVDRRDVETLGALFSADAVLVTPRGELRGRSEIAGIPEQHASRYRVTHHLVSGHVVHDSASESEATGWVECSAHHVYEVDGTERVYVMHIRYHDQYRVEGGSWVFAHRRLELLWKEDHLLQT